MPQASILGSPNVLLCGCVRSAIAGVGVALALASCLEMLRLMLGRSGGGGGA